MMDSMGRNRLWEEADRLVVFATIQSKTGFFHVERPSFAAISIFVFRADIVANIDDDSQ